MDNFSEANVVFVADFFLDEYSGGAEKSTEALFETSPHNTVKVKSEKVTKELISQATDKFWVFFNYRGIDHNLIPMIVGNLNYAVVEYDYKFCQYRSIDLHKRETGKNCDCDNTKLGKYISAFMHGSEHIFWMSKKQSEIYHEKFPFLKESKQTVLSSIFSIKDLEYIEALRFNKVDNNGKWAVIDGNSWIKGVNESVAAVKQSNDDVNVEVIGGLEYYDLLSKLVEYKGLSFHPLGGDTCPRTVIEARLLDLQLSLGDHVQHLGEDWWQKSRDEMEDYLLSRHETFWNVITGFLDRKVTLSGYTTTHNVITHDYPWREAINSLLGFCDEVVVVDGGSTDGTWEELSQWAEKESKLKIKQLDCDWDSERFALYDFQNKAAARSLCTSEWCWQMDVDEIVHEDDYKKIKVLAKRLPKALQVLCLPVIDFWGNEDKVRLDVHPWKLRLSRNSDHITHDIPQQHRRTDSEGRLYSAGSDGCDYVNKEDFTYIPTSNFYTADHDRVRQMLLSNEEYRKDNLGVYQNFINAVTKELPTVYHYSWYDIKRKIYNYRDFWSKFHASLYNKEVVDNAENNKFFNKSWSEVSEEEIVNMAKTLNNRFGGWIFHSRVDLEKPTPWYHIEKDHPEIIKEWLQTRK